MKEIHFKFDTNADTGERANILMQWLVNRAYKFDKTKYTQVCLHLEDSPESAVALEMCFIINTFTDILFYVPKKEAKICRTYMKNNVVIALSDKKWKKMSQQINTMHWDVQSVVGRYPVCDGATIFYGITHDKIKEIAELLYGWIDDRKVYKKKLKQAIREAKRAMREEQKQLKKMQKESAK